MLTLSFSAVFLLCLIVPSTDAFRCFSHSRRLHLGKSKMSSANTLHMTTESSEGDNYLGFFSGDENEDFTDEPISRNFLPSGPSDLAPVVASASDQSSRFFKR